MKSSGLDKLLFTPFVKWDDIEKIWDRSDKQLYSQSILQLNSNQQISNNKAVSQHELIKGRTTDGLYLLAVNIL